VALSSGRWLWSALVGGFGREPDFSGWFDAIIVFFFDVPNLAIAELVIRVSRRNWSVLVDSGGICAAACLPQRLHRVATSMFTAGLWWPWIVGAAM
jgi:hypothetical protein